MHTPIEYLNGINRQRGEALRKELNVATFQNLLELFPFRHIDKTKVDKIAALTAAVEYAYVAGRLVSKEIIGENRSRRLVAKIKDDTGILELVWFRGINWIDNFLELQQVYLIFGRLSFFMYQPQVPHPEIEIYNPQNAKGKSSWEPFYPGTEKLKAKGITNSNMGKFTQALFQQLSPNDIPENLPAALLEKYKLMPRYTAYQQIHFPKTLQQYQMAVRRLKFDELFFAQMRVQLIKLQRHRFSKGYAFTKLGDLFTNFYNNYLPFTLTNAQKNVLKEIRSDVGSGRQMNRLLQGDVGSGKTMVALLSMLMAADNFSEEKQAPFQSVLMAPTEILARQHYDNIKELVKDLPIEIGLLTGSTKIKMRRTLLEQAAEGSLHILIGTHAVIEEKVQFKNLGFAVVDEQHKFGVAQRAKLWKKNGLPPHILVMTATPIPRTLALTAYGDLDYSVMDELPPGRKLIETFHRNERHRPQVMDFIRTQIKEGRQAYIIYPLIEESSVLDYENLMKGYEEVKSFFPEPLFYISMVHGKQAADVKQTNMNRFVRNNTQIMVSTTVIEVGVNVPNASVMVIESAEKFGLSQLHQLRGRVGRGADKSYCILLTGNKVSNDARERLKIMVDTNDGFKIAEKDLEIRGPGDIDGTRQSGEMLFKLASIVNDKPILEVAKIEVENIIASDPDLAAPENECVKTFLHTAQSKTKWGKIA